MAQFIYVNGRYLAYADAGVHAEDRGFQFADAVYEVCEVRDGRLIDETRHMRRLERSLGELKIRQPMTFAAWSRVLRETIRRNRVRDGLVYLQVSRGSGRPRDFLFPPADAPPTVVCLARPAARAKAETAAAKGIAVKTMPDQRWGALRHQDDDAAAVGHGQGGGPRRGRQGGLAGRRQGLRHRGRLQQCLDRRSRRQPRHPPGRPRHPAGGDTQDADRRARAPRPRSSSSEPSRSRRQSGHARPSSPRQPTSSCRSCASTAARSATASPAASQRRSGPPFTARPRSPAHDMTSARWTELQAAIVRVLSCGINCNMQRTHLLSACLDAPLPERIVLAMLVWSEQRGDVNAGATIVLSTQSIFVGRGDSD